MMDKKILPITLLIFSVFFLINTSIADEKVTWKFAGIHAVTTPETKGENYFAKLVKGKSQGNFIVNVYPAQQLGTSVDILENLMMGSVDMYGNSMGQSQFFVKDFGIFSMPFLFKDLDAIKKFQKSTLYQQLLERLVTEKGVRAISANWYRLPRVLVAKRPIMTLDDLQGLKMRMASVKTFFETWRDLGANVTSLPWGEVYLALKKGIVDACDSPLGSVYGQKFYRAAPYIMLTYHDIAPFNVLVNEKKYQKLPEQYKKILYEAGKEAGDYYTKILVDSFNVEKAKMEKEGAKFLAVDTAPFAQKAATIAERYESEGMWKKGLFEEILKSQ